MSNQNNSNEELNAVPASEQNKLPANTTQPSLENEPVSTSETLLPVIQTEPPMEVHHHGHVHETKKGRILVPLFHAFFDGDFFYKMNNGIECNRFKFWFPRLKILCGQSRKH